jgi:hypothetical protein
MIRSDCPNCGSEVGFLARTCGRCGAPNPARRNGVIVIAAVAVLGVAIVVAAAVALRSAGQPEPGAAEQRAAAAGDFSWLEKALKDCDAEAAKLENALHFLVTPLVDEPTDEAGWRRISTNDIGNAILIKSEDMLAGLKRKALRLSTDQYVFSARVEASKAVLTWKPAVGVKKFVYENAADMTDFRVQFQPRDASRAPNWGAPFKRLAGNCYWVNAILRH